MKLEDIGWSPYFDKNFKTYKEKGFKAARIYVEHRNVYGIYSEYGDMAGEIPGRLRHELSSAGDYPAVGDWVAVSPVLGEGKALIQGVLPRKSKFSRKTAGNITEEQVVASNIDTVMLVASLNSNFNLRRIERYLTMAWESNANPVIVLSKADLCSDVDEKRREVEAIAFGVPVHVVSALSGMGMNGLKQRIKKGSTTALLGSSGVGKSSIINYLADSNIQEVGEIRESDGRGRHTTTSRNLIILPDGGIILDTPGMRELQLWNGSEGAAETFDDIQKLAQGCRFKNCTHSGEPGCAVRQAVEEGYVDAERIESYHKLNKEIRYIEEKQRKIARRAKKKLCNKKQVRIKPKYDIDMY